MLSSLIYFIAKVSLLELYPAYNCYKTLKYGKTEQFAPSLVYWITATVFIVVEYFADLLLFWVPFYSEMKLIILLWLTLPQTKGALVLYADLIEPFLERHESLIDKSIADCQATVKGMLSHYGKLVYQILRQMISQVVNKSLNPEESPNGLEESVSESHSTVEQSWATWIPTGASLSLLVTRGAQLSEQFKRVPQSESKSADDAHLASAPVEVGSDRSESYDSLNSLVLPKKPEAKLSSKTASNNSNVSWGAYLQSFVWKTSNENMETQEKKVE